MSFLKWLTYADFVARLYESRALPLSYFCDKASSINERGTSAKLGAFGSADSPGNLNAFTIVPISIFGLIPDKNSFHGRTCPASIDFSQ
jgi:hypothetical protein